MSNKDKDAGTPRVFLIRHGETEWSKSGRHTGRTEIPLTANGESQVTATSNAIVGRGKLIDPRKVVHVFCSPRIRAKRTYDILFHDADQQELEERVETTEDIREWDYGAYEGLLPAEIRAGRKEKGLDLERPWNIWIDGCENGESPSEVTTRLDKVIATIKEWQGPFMHGERDVDIVLIAHGHILRAFAKRWIEYDLAVRLPFMIEPGAVCVLSYEHHSVKEPALLLGVNLGSKSEC